MSETKNIKRNSTRPSAQNRPFNQGSGFHRLSEKQMKAENEELVKLSEWKKLSK